MSLEFDLPFVQGAISAHEALQTVRTQHVAALVAELPSGNQIFTAEALTRAIRQWGTEVRVNLIPGIETVAVPKVASPLIGAILEQARVRFGVLDVGGERVHLVSRFAEQAKELLGAVRICTCTTNADHVYLESDLNASHKCQLDGGDLNCG